MAAYGVFPVFGLQIAVVFALFSLNAWNKLNSYFSGMTFVLPDDLSSQYHFNNQQ